MKRYLIIGGVVTLSLSVGSAVAGYHVAKKRLETKYAQIAEQEIIEARKYYSKMHKKDEYSTPESTVKVKGLLLDEAAEALRSYQGAEEVVDVEVVETVEEAKTIKISDYVGEVVTNNVFEGATLAGLDVESRSSENPYVVSLDEYMDNEDKHEQLTLTHYVGDNVTCDERDEPIEDVDGVIGELNLQRFGVGSGDPNVVMVRNERLKLDFEICKSTGKFSKEVLGFDGQ